MDSLSTEEKILILFSSDNYSPDVRNAAGEFATNFQASPEGLKWAVETFPVQTNITLAIYAINILRPYIKNNFSAFSEDTLFMLKSMLFNPQLHLPFKGNITFTNLLADLQVTFFWQAYPDIWPGFWDDEFQMPENDVMSFLDALCQFANILSGTENLVYNRIKDTMRETNADLKVANFVIEKMIQKKALAFKCFAHLCKWVNINYLMNENGLSAFLAGFQDINFMRFSFEIFMRLTARGMPIESKQALLSSIDLPELVLEIISRDDIGDDILLASAEAINNAGLEILKTDSFQKYLQIALALFKCDNDDIGDAVSLFILETIKTYPSYNQVIMDAAISRLETFFSKCNDKIEIKGFMEKVTMILHSSLMTNIKVTLKSLEYLAIQQDFYANMARAAAVVHAVYDIMITKDPYIKEVVLVFVQNFYPILKISPDEIGPIQLQCISDFINMFIVVHIYFNEELISQIFSDLITLLSNSTNPFLQNYISQIIVTYVKKLSKKIIFEPNHIYTFISTYNQSLVSAAAILICSLNENKNQIFIQSLQALNKFSEDAKDKKNAFSIILNFIKFLKYDENAQFTEIVSQFLKNMFEHVINDDELFSLFIHSAYSSLGNNSKGIIEESIQKLNYSYYLSITAISEALSALIVKNGDNSWISSFIIKLSMLNFELFGTIDEWLYSSDESKGYIEMIMKFLKLCSKLFKHSPNCFDEQIGNVLLPFIKNSLEKNFDIPLLVQASIELLNSIINIIPNIVVQFTPLLLNFLNTSKFDPMINDWFQICKRLMTLHLSMLSLDEQEGIRIISASFEQFNASPEIIQEYFMVLASQRPRDRVSSGRSFFINFVRYRKIIGI